MLTIISRHCGREGWCGLTGCNDACRLLPTVISSSFHGDRDTSSPSLSSLLFDDSTRSLWEGGRVRRVRGRVSRRDVTEGCEGTANRSGHPQ